LGFSRAASPLEQSLAHDQANWSQDLLEHLSELPDAQDPSAYLQHLADLIRRLRDQ
ncbi:hypothetical protein FRC07_007086, partial [Ceratobasidium sp. 392]